MTSSACLYCILPNVSKEGRYATPLTDIIHFPTLEHHLNPWPYACTNSFMLFYTINSINLLHVLIT